MLLEEKINVTIVTHLISNTHEDMSSCVTDHMYIPCAYIYMSSSGIHNVSTIAFQSVTILLLLSMWLLITATISHNWAVWEYEGYSVGVFSYVATDIPCGYYNWMYV